MVPFGGEFVVAHAIAVVCSAGYVHPGGSSGATTVRTCGQDSKWDGTEAAASCEPLTCPAAASAGDRDVS